MAVLKIDPVTRLEGHLKVEVELDGSNNIISAKTTGNMFRSFENILIGRDPRDGIQFTQRICGVCPVDHAIAAVKAFEKSVNFTPNTQARLIRNLIQGANFIASHILHFYHLAAMDYAKGPQMAPWTPGYNTDYRLSSTENNAVVNNYVQALHIRRKAQEMGAILSGKMPHVMSVVPGGVSVKPTSTDITNFRNYLTEIKNFITNTYIPDVNFIASKYPEYFNIGRGYGNLLAFGVFDTDGAGNTYFVRGRYTNAIYGSVDTTQIIENTKYSWYSDTSKNPASGTTTPNATKSGAYTWLKSPRYSGIAHECGPLARMWMNNFYRIGISVMDRHKARALEAQKVAEQMTNWINSVAAGASGYSRVTLPTSGTGIGLTEATRGALGHWLSYSSSKATSYQIITPTCWNAAPKDDTGNFGPIEQALIGVHVANPAEPVEILRVIHSFDPCTGCSVHVLNSEQQILKQFVISPFSA
jgi:hydrogenase large subunit